MPFFSIIIPTYNSEKTLKKCLESVINQKFDDFEVVIIDGVSSDKTLEIAENYSDSRIKIFSEKDKGIYDAMNKGIDKSTGRWLYFLGSDDELFDNEVLSLICNTIQSSTEKIVYGNVLVSGDSGWAKNDNIYDGIFALEKILRKNICHQAIFYHKSVFDSIGYFNTSYSVSADWDFNLRCYAKYIFLYVNTKIAKFSGGNTSFAHKDAEFHKNYARNILKYFERNLYKKEFVPFLKKVQNENCKYKLLYFLSRFNRKMSKLLK
ncbi:MAG: glycosyltransferase [Dysgonamonadaceae bacterium]|jgi:glycosyltransferase involved in cell wall biosynthesis|nr:glycosyltransferase [Dysgonamonadaceae bacterium]